MGEAFITFLCLLWLAYRLGEDDGRWGCFKFLIALTVIVLILAKISS